MTSPDFNTALLIFSLATADTFPPAGKQHLATRSSAAIALGKKRLPVASIEISQAQARFFSYTEGHQRCDRQTDLHFGIII